MQLHKTSYNLTILFLHSYSLQKSVWILKFIVFEPFQLAWCIINILIPTIKSCIREVGVDGREVSKSRIRGIIIIVLLQRKREILCCIHFYGHGMTMMTRTRWGLKILNMWEARRNRITVISTIRSGYNLYETRSE